MAQRVIDNLAVRRAKVYVGQAVHLDVVESYIFNNNPQKRVLDCQNYRFCIFYQFRHK